MLAATVRAATMQDHPLTLQGVQTVDGAPQAMVCSICLVLVKFGATTRRTRCILKCQNLVGFVVYFLRIRDVKIHQNLLSIKFHQNFH